MDLQEYFREISGTEDEESRRRLIYQAVSELSEEDGIRLRYMLEGSNTLNDDQLRIFDEAASAAQRQQDLDTFVSNAVPDNAIMTDIDRLEAEQSAESAFNAQNPDGEGGEETTTPTTDISPDLVWLIKQTNGGQFFSPEQEQRIVRDFNDLNGTQFDSVDQMARAGVFASKDADTMETIEFALADRKPIEDFEIPMGRNRSTHVRKFEMESAVRRFGVSEEEVSRMARLSDRAGLKDGDRIWWQLGLALAQATGMYSDLTSGKEVPVEPLVDENGNGSTFDEAIARAEQGPVETEMMFDEGAIDDPTFLTRDRFPNLPDKLIRAEFPGVQRQERLSFRQLSQRVREGYEKYNGDLTIATIHALDPGLAGRLVRSGGDPLKLSGKDVTRAKGLLSSAGFAGFTQWQTGMAEMGFGEVYDTGFESMWNFMDARDAAEAAARAAAQGPAEPAGPQFPDPAGIDETIRQLYEQYFLEDADDDTIAQFRSRINAAVQDAFDNDISSVNISARAQQFLREQPEYEALYGNKPEGVSEQEYANQMQNGQRSMLGAELAGNAAAKQGMKTGKYQTAVGAAAGTTEAWDNSTFLGRLARAGEVVGRNT